MNFKISTRDSLFNLRKLDPFMQGHNGFIAGGVFKNIFNDEPFRDVDIFFRNEEDYEQALAHFRYNRNYKKLYENDNCYAFTHKTLGVDVELIKRTFGTPQEIIEMFDFSIVRAAYYTPTQPSLQNTNIEFDWLESPDVIPTTQSPMSPELIHVDRFFEDLHLKKLVIDIDFDKIPLPANTFDRAFKYQRYGYSLCRESKIKLIESLRTLQGDIDLNKSLYYGID